jgi:hypothetical protein
MFLAYNKHAFVPIFMFLCLKLFLLGYKEKHEFILNKEAHNILTWPICFLFLDHEWLMENFKIKDVLREKDRIIVLSLWSWDTIFLKLLSFWWTNLTVVYIV